MKLEQLERIPVYTEQHCMCPGCRDGVIHASDCAVHNAPAEPIGACDCNASEATHKCEGWDY